MTVRIRFGTCGRELDGKIAEDILDALVFIVSGRDTSFFVF